MKRASTRSRDIKAPILPIIWSARIRGRNKRQSVTSLQLELRDFIARRTYSACNYYGVTLLRDEILDVSRGEFRESLYTAQFLISSSWVSGGGGNIYRRLILIESSLCHYVDKYYSPVVSRFCHARLFIIQMTNSSGTHLYVCLTAVGKNLLATRLTGNSQTVFRKAMPLLIYVCFDNEKLTVPVQRKENDDKATPAVAPSSLPLVYAVSPKSCNIFLWYFPDMFSQWLFF